MRTWPFLFPLLVALESAASVELAVRRALRSLRCGRLALELGDGKGLRDDDLGW